MPTAPLRPVAVILFGTPGSGKGTVGRIVSQVTTRPHISTGHLLREHISAGDGIGQLIENLLSAGEFAPDDLVNEMVRSRVKAGDCRYGFLLDGYPRTLGQAEALHCWLEREGWEPLVIQLRVDYNKIVIRLTSRRTCPTCGAIYNILSSPPSVDGLCDQDRTELILRDDDRETVVWERMAIYEKRTEPVAKFFEKSAIRCIEIDGSESQPGEIADRVCELAGWQLRQRSMAAAG
jgi:adenylate kinase